MSRHTSIRFFTLLFALVLAACAPSASSSEGSPIADDCASSVEGGLVLSDATHGFCLEYPSGYDIEHVDANQKVLYIGALTNVTQPRLFINVQSAAGRSTSKLADEIAAQFEGFTLQRSNVTLGGKAAVLLNNIPGQDLSRQLLVVNGDLAYMLTFTPIDDGQHELMQQLEALYKMVIDSFSFVSSQ